MTLEINKINDDDWDNIQLISKHSSVYTTSTFLNSSKISVSKIVFKENEQIIATAIIKKDFDVYDYSLYQGINIVQSNSKNINKNFIKEFAVLKEIIELLTKEFDHFTLNLSFRFIDLRPFLWHNYNFEYKKHFILDLKYTGIINLSNYENFDIYLNSIRSVRRQEYRKCITNKFNILESNNLEEFFRLYILTFERQDMHVSDAEISNIRDLCKMMFDKELAKMFYCVNKDGVIMSAIIVFIYNNNMYYQFGATDPIFRNTGASVMLILNAIKIAYQNKIEFFDMVGINSPNRGDFKMSFNANPYPYYNVKW
uniref:GNAT family N-acetyltransferase n=1 Tax=Algoriphagus sp. TaxID=1872435 RepID=UPI004047B096